MTVFGPIVPATVVRKQALDTLRTWLPTYLAEYQRQVEWEAGYNVAPPKSFGIPTQTFDKAPEALTPHIAIDMAGGENVQVRENGFHDMQEGFEVVSVVYAPKAEDVATLSEIYVAAVASVLVEQPLGAPVELVAYNGWSPRPETTDTDRNLVAVTSRFTAYVNDVAQRGAGPRVVPVPPGDPPPDDPTVETVGIVGQRLPIAD